MAEVTVAPAMSERQLQDAVIDCAQHLGWLVYHTHDSRRSQAGFPDLVLVRRAWVIFAELKAEKGKLTKEQETWANAIVNTDAHYYLWRPADWLGGKIERLLR